MMVCSDRKMVFEYMQSAVGLTWSDDMRGMMFVPEEFRGMVTSKSHVAACFAFSNFVGKTASFHVAITDGTKITRWMLKEVFEFAFNVCGLEALVATIDSTNEKSCKFAVKVGGTLIHRIKDGGLDGDMMYYQMLRNDCIWIKEKVRGKRLTRSA